jgi:hypothetical protein
MRLLSCQLILHIVFGELPPSDTRLRAAASPTVTPTISPASAYSSPEYERRLTTALQTQGNGGGSWRSQYGSSGGALPLLTAYQRQDQLYVSIRQQKCAPGTPSYRGDSLDVGDMSGHARLEPSASNFGDALQAEQRRNKPARDRNQGNDMPVLPPGRFTSPSLARPPHLRCRAPATHEYFRVTRSYQRCTTISLHAGVPAFTRGQICGESNLLRF